MLIDMYVAHLNAPSHVPARSSKEGTPPTDRVGLRTGEWPVVLVVVITQLPHRCSCATSLLASKSILLMSWSNGSRVAYMQGQPTNDNWSPMNNLLCDLVIRFSMLRCCKEWKRQEEIHIQCLLHMHPHSHSLSRTLSLLETLHSAHF